MIDDQEVLDLIHNLREEVDGHTNIVQRQMKLLESVAENIKQYHFNNDTHQLDTIQLITDNIEKLHNKNNESINNSLTTLTQDFSALETRLRYVESREKAIIALVVVVALIAILI